MIFNQLKIRTKTMKTKLIGMLLAFATLSAHAQVNECHVQVERTFAETMVAQLTGKPTTGMVVVSFDNPVYTGTIDGNNKYRGNLVIEFPNGQETQTLHGVELIGQYVCS